MLPTAEELKNKVLHELEMTSELDDDMVGQVIDRVILDASRQEFIPMREKLRLRKELFHSIRGLDVLSELMEDPEITEIMINGTSPIFVEKKGHLLKTEFRFTDEERLLSVIGQMVSAANRTVNETNPIADAVLPDGSRVNVVLSGVSKDGPVVTIRRFPKYSFSMEDLVRMESLDRDAADFLRILVKAKYNIFISGENHIIGLSHLTFREKKGT